MQVQASLVLLRSGSHDARSATIRLPFLILPHLSKDAIIGRDFLQRQRYVITSTPTGSCLQLGPVVETEQSTRDRLEKTASSIELLESSGLSTWHLTVVTAVRLAAGQDSHVLVRVQHMSTDAVVEQPEADLIVDIQHPDLFPGLLVVGSGAMTVVLRSLRDCSLADGEVLGPASLLTAVTGSTHAADDTGGADSVRADLGHLLGQSIDTQAGSLAVDSVSTATLATYVSENEAIDMVLEDLRTKLPSHMDATTTGFG